MSRTYFVSLDVVYTTVVEAETEDEAIEKASHEILLDVDTSVEPLVIEWEGDA